MVFELSGVNNQEYPDYSKYGSVGAGGGYISQKTDAIDFKAKERHVDISGVSTFCNPKVYS